jgi:pyrroloquinoline quinone (PQQ) biosynthesis protein C
MSAITSTPVGWTISKSETVDHGALTMAFNWPGKKEVREAAAKPEFPTALEADIAEVTGDKGENPLRSVVRESLPRASTTNADTLAALTERLETLGKMLDEAKEQVTSYLLHRESQSESDASKVLVRKVDALAERLEQGSGGRGLDQKLDALYGKLDQLANAAGRSDTASAASSGNGGLGLSDAEIKSALRPLAEKLEQFDAKLKAIDALKEAVVAAVGKLRESHSEQHITQSAGIRQISEMVPQYFNALPQYFTAIQQQVVAAQQHTDAGLRAIIDILRPPQPEASAGGATVGGDWQEALLGGELAHNPALNLDKNQLLNGVLSGDPGACGLVGSLLQFRAAPADKMPPLLKDVGEAFYRWQPKTSNRASEMEKALAQWLMRACDQAGMANTIELVNPGERFDSLRHNASRPGVEIAQVLGWIVLRDNGKVYTKAAVTVK